jgi:hypothetical protein
MDWINLDQDWAQWCVHSNEPSGSIKRGELLYYLSDYQLPEKGSAPLS